MIQSVSLIKSCRYFPRMVDYSARSLNADDLINMVCLCLIQALVFMIGIKKAELENAFLNGEHF